MYTGIYNEHGVTYVIQIQVVYLVPEAAEFRPSARHTVRISTHSARTVILTDVFIYD